MDSDDQRRVLDPGDSESRGVPAEMWGKFRAMHGSQHLLDGAAPAIGFLIGYSVAGAEVGVSVAILIAVVLGAARLLRGDSVRVVAAAALAILVFALFVEITEEGRGFYSPEVALSVVMTVLFGATLLTGKPLSYTVTRKIRLEPAEPDDPVARLHRRIALARFVFWAVHVAAVIPRYLVDKIVLLGSSAVDFGKPALVIMLAPTWVRDRSTARMAAA